MFTNEPDRQEPINEIENRLALWKPAATALDRDTLLYEAGRAAGRAEMRSHIVHGSLACSLIAIVVLGGTLVRDRPRNDAIKPNRGGAIIIESATNAAPNPDAIAIDRGWEPAPILSTDSYLALSRAAGSGGFESAPRPNPSESSTRSNSTDYASPPTLNARSSSLDLKDL